MNLKWNLSIQDEVSDLLINKDFLRFFKKFLLQWAVDMNYLQTETYNFLEVFLNDNLDSTNLDFSKKEILFAIWNIFSIPIVLNSFLDYIFRFKNHLDFKEYQLLSEVADYLISVYNNADRYNDIWLIEEQLKTKVKNILPREVEEIRLKLFQKKFPQFTQEDLPIVWADFKDYIDVLKWGDTQNHVYLKIKDYSWRDYYINRNWRFLIDNSWKNIIQVYYYFYFWNYLVAKFRNEHMETILEITDIETFDYVSNWYTDAINWELNDGDWNILEYLYLSREENLDIVSWVFDKEINRIDILDILKFLNPEDAETLTLTLDLLKWMKVSKIWKLHIINWYKFLELEIESTYIDKIDWVERPIYNDIVLADNWKVIFDKKSDYDGIEYAKQLLDEYYIFWKKFIGFVLDRNNLSWHIDANCELVKVNWENLISLKKHHLKILGGEDFYILNWDDKKIISESSILKQLSKYKSFDLKEVKVYLDEDTYFDYQNSQITWIYWELKKDGSVQVSLLWEGDTSINISYRDLIELLKNSKKTKKVLTFFNEQLKNL